MAAVAVTAKIAKRAAATNALPAAAATSNPAVAAVTPVAAEGTVPLWPWLLLAGTGVTGWLWWRSR